MARADKTVVLNVRVSERQARWLRNVAEAHHNGNLSEAVRQSVDDAWMFRQVRDEYRAMRQHEGFRFPRNDDDLTRPIELLLGWDLTLTWDEDDEKRV